MWVRTAAAVGAAVAATAALTLTTAVGGASAQTNCDPSYPSMCLETGIGDYDCAGGSGDGPNYVQGPIEVRAPDPFGLDADHNGIGCE
jgi:hypothetical protein